MLGERDGIMTISSFKTELVTDERGLSTLRMKCYCRYTLMETLIVGMDAHIRYNKAVAEMRQLFVYAIYCMIVEKSIQYKQQVKIVVS